MLTSIKASLVSIKSLLMSIIALLCLHKIKRGAHRYVDVESFLGDCQVP